MFGHTGFFFAQIFEENLEISRALQIEITLHAHANPYFEKREQITNVRMKARVGWVEGVRDSEIVYVSRAEIR